MSKPKMTVLQKLKKTDRLLALKEMKKQLAKMYGKRCKTICVDCLSCRLYLAFDMLDLHLGDGLESGKWCRHSLVK